MTTNVNGSPGPGLIDVLIALCAGVVLLALLAPPRPSRGKPEQPLLPFHPELPETPAPEVTAA